jgi:UDP-glucose 4-epimerase
VQEKTVARVLITGGAGFIGSHLTEALLARHHVVTALDDLSTGRLDNILHLIGNPAFRFELGSILDADRVNQLAAECDEIYHLGAAVGVRLIYEHPVHTIETNVRGGSVVLEAALRHGRKVFIASTSEVYGKDPNGVEGKFLETENITIGVSMRWCYASSKALDEYLARAYFREKGLPIVIGRFFNTVGPRQIGTYGMVVPRLVQQALQGRPLTVYGDGEQKRSFAWVGDTVDAAVRLMETPVAVGEIFNIGNDEAITINELARRILSLTGSSSQIVHVPYEEAYGADFEDIRSRVPDITRLRETIGYRPTLNTDAILKRIIAHVAQGSEQGTTDENVPGKRR